jgi:hypothetical protein
VISRLSDGAFVPMPTEPSLFILTFSAAASLAPVLNIRDVAFDDELKSPSETASIPAATNIASVPFASSGA